MVAPYSVRIHPFSWTPSVGDRGYLLRVLGSSEHLFSRHLPGAPGHPILYGPAPRVLGLDVEAEGACAVLSVADGIAVIRPLSDEEGRALRAEIGAGDP